MLSFDDPEDELVFALFLPCGMLIALLLAAIVLPALACLWCGRGAARMARALLRAVGHFSAWGMPGTQGDRVVF